MSELLIVALFFRQLQNDEGNRSSKFGKAFIGKFNSSKVMASLEGLLN
jgi:hypothetical protein